jgi:hypothetical protein
VIADNPASKRAKRKSTAIAVAPVYRTCRTISVGAAGECKARLIAQTSVLKRCFDVSFSIGTFSDVSDDTWDMLAERFKDSGRYEVDSHAGDMPSSEFVGR